MNILKQALHIYNPLVETEAYFGRTFCGISEMNVVQDPWAMAISVRDSYEKNWFSIGDKYVPCKRCFEAEDREISLLSLV